MAGTLVSDKHVRVDFLRQNMSQKHKTIVDLLGHVVFLLPLCGIVAFHGYDFTIRSWNMNEGSNYDGLYNRFILKSFIPIGFSMLFLAGLGLILRDLNALFRSKHEATDD
jgi:TRAP-type mannitol/chloroaromatic compound transport system permease small subunit